MSDLEGCIKTFEQTRDELEEIERKLAERYKDVLAHRYRTRRHIRLALIELDKRGLLVEDELVADWYDAYSSYLDWATASVQEDEDVVLRAPPERCPAPKREMQSGEAAEAASSLFVL